MPEEWDNLEGVDAAERVLRAALSARAEEVHVSCDSGGASVYLSGQELIEFLVYLSPDCRDKMLRYLRDRSGIDQWKPAPVKGLAVFDRFGKSYQLEVRFLPGSHGGDVFIRISGK